MQNDALGQIGIRVGDLLSNKYRVDSVLGAGGMGIVVAAHHLQLDERVAIKLLLPEGVTNREAVARFLREARAAVKIKSEHVARVIDVGTLESGTPYMVMEYLAGADLAAVLESRGTLPVEETVQYVLQACEAVAEAHALGIVHRDLKPANLFLCQRPGRTPTIKVLDFGISKTAFQGSTSDQVQTAAHTLLGSPIYMSPEQMMSAAEVDQRTDIWSLGIILHELLVGQTPFRGNSLAQLAMAIMQQPVPTLAAGGLPPRLQTLIYRCLEKDRTARFQHIGELASGLCEFVPDQGRVSLERISQAMLAGGMASSSLIPSVAPSAVPTSTPPRADGITVSPWSQTRGGAHRRGLTWAGLALGALGLAAGLFFVLRGTNRPPIAASVAAAGVAAASAPLPIDAPRPAAVVLAPPHAEVVTAVAAASAPRSSGKVPELSRHAAVSAPAKSALSAPQPPVPSAVIPSPPPARNPLDIRPQ